MRKNSSEFITAFTSEAGTFHTNRDFYAFVELDDIACYVVADGIDSDEEINSAELAANCIFEQVMEKPSMSKSKLKKYIINAHKLLNEKSVNVRLKSSIAVVLTDYTNMIWAVVGNARVYHFRKGSLIFRSKDQSVAQMMLDSKKITEDEINQHDERNNLINYLGQPRGFKPFVSKKIKLNDDDALIMCTSGFWEKINNIDLVDAFREEEEPSSIIDNLEEIFLSRQSRVINNYTLAMVLAKKVFKEEQKHIRKNRFFKKLIKILIPVLIAGTIGLIYIQYNKGKARNQIVEYVEEGHKYLEKGILVDAQNSFIEAEKLTRTVKDKEKQEILNEQIEVLKEILKGDEFFKSGNYVDARETYNNTKSTLIYINNFDKSIFEKLVNERIDEIVQFINIQDIIKYADELMKNAKESKSGDIHDAQTKYDEALEKYQEAKKLAEEIGDEKMISEIENKSEEAEQGSKEIKEHMEKKENEGKLIEMAEKAEKQGDKYFQKKQYEEGIDEYKASVQFYEKIETQNVEIIEKIAAIERKIRNAEREIEKIKAEEEQKKDE
jgi:serine/threonine protein phosphatase PrpC